MTYGSPKANEGFPSFREIPWMRVYALKPKEIIVEDHCILVGSDVSIEEIVFSLNLSEFDKRMLHQMMVKT